MISQFSIIESTITFFLCVFVCIVKYKEIDFVCVNILFGMQSRSMSELLRFANGWIFIMKYWDLYWMGQANIKNLLNIFNCLAMNWLCYW